MTTGGSWKVAVRSVFDRLVVKPIVAVNEMPVTRPVDEATKSGPGTTNFGSELASRAGAVEYLGKTGKGEVRGSSGEYERVGDPGIDIFRVADRSEMLCRSPHEGLVKYTRARSSLPRTRGV
jgi:hypothetical protein